MYDAYSVLFQSKEPQGQFPIAGATLTTETIGTSSSLTTFNFLSGGGGGNPSLQFQIHTADGHRTYHLEARNQSEFKQWTDLLRTAIPKAGPYVPTQANFIKDRDDEEEAPHPAPGAPAVPAGPPPEQEEDGDIDNEPDDGGAEKDDRFHFELQGMTAQML